MQREGGVMKTFQAYGGKVRLYNIGPGWEWQVRRSKKFSPHRINQFGAQIVYLGTSAFGSAKSMRDARRNAVNSLKGTA